MSAADRLRELLDGPGILVVPGYYDAISARLIERAGFETAFMGGFLVSGSRLGVPDTGLISYAEMVDQGRNICAAVSFQVIGDADTGFGNPVNVRRTVRGYADAGFACVMIEDQLSPKRCGHTPGKQTVGRQEAFSRIEAAVDARDEGADILIMARTDALGTEGLEEAITLALAGIPAMERALAALRRGASPEGLADFSQLKEVVGFPECYEAEGRYAPS